jgi:DNA-binding XRE family transcriptional regulator
MTQHHRWLRTALQGPGSCNQTVMELPPRPDPLHERLARATARVNATMARVSQAQEVVTEAKERLALTRLALEHTTARGAHDPPRLTPGRGGGGMKTIRALREARGESHLQLAEAIGVTSKEITDWETGTAEPTISRLRALTEHFGVRDDQIIFGRDTHHPSLSA